jgi:beta-hydroxyacyl-ACP dehydratase FabZ
MGIAGIRSALPHRYPMLLVDRILELEPGKRAVGLKNVTINEEFFQGHFPDRPIMPGVLILEAMAQVGAALLASDERLAGRIPMFGAMNQVRFRRPVVPGDQLITEFTITRTRGDFGWAHAVARVEGQVAAEADYTFVLLREEQLNTAKAEA